MHSLITGTTESGKTTLAKAIATNWPGSVIVLDPLGDTWPDGSEVYSEIEPFIQRVKNAEDSLLIVDETGYTVDRYDKDHAWLATQSRHQGHSAIFLAQGYKQIAPIVRSQAVVIYAFAGGPADAKIIGEDFLLPDAENVIPFVPQLHAIKIHKFKPPSGIIVKPGEKIKVYHLTKPELMAIVNSARRNRAE